MTTSILNTIKQMLGIPITDSAFDQDILVHINSAFMNLNQLGVGPEIVYSIEDATSLWEDFLSDPTLYPSAKTYIYLKVKQSFDPAGTSFVLTSIKDQILELEWRLAAQVPIPPDPIVDPDL